MLDKQILLKVPIKKGEPQWAGSPFFRTGESMKKQKLKVSDAATREPKPSRGVMPQKMFPTWLNAADVPTEAARDYEREVLTQGGAAQ